MYTRQPLDEQEDLGVIAFEPMYDKWGTLIAQNGHERMIALPVAVAQKYFERIIAPLSTADGSQPSGKDI